MAPGCTECERLWCELGEAIKYHLKLVGEYQVAIFQQDFTKLDALEPLCRQAEQGRIAARKAAMEHQAAHNR